MQLFELIVKLSSVLHGTSIKLGYHKEYLFFKIYKKRIVQKIMRLLYLLA
jgi:hypothetical protein